MSLRLSCGLICGLLRISSERIPSLAKEARHGAPLRQAMGHPGYGGRCRRRSLKALIFFPFLSVLLPFANHGHRAMHVTLGNTPLTKMVPLCYVAVRHNVRRWRNCWAG